MAECCGPATYSSPIQAATTYVAESAPDVVSKIRHARSLDGDLKEVRAASRVPKREVPLLRTVASFSLLDAGDNAHRRPRSRRRAYISRLTNMSTPSSWPSFSAT